jgi:predicted transcriptional regulator
MAQEKMTKLTVDLQDRDLYRALRHAAIERDRPVREIVVEALRQWLERYEDEMDAADIAATRDEETIPWEHVKREMEEARSKQPIAEAGIP